MSFSVVIMFYKDYMNYAAGFAKDFPLEVNLWQLPHIIQERWKLMETPHPYDLCLI